MSRDSTITTIIIVKLRKTSREIMTTFKSMICNKTTILMNVWTQTISINKPIPSKKLIPNNNKMKKSSTTLSD